MSPTFLYIIIDTEEEKHSIHHGKAAQIQFAFENISELLMASLGEG